MIHISLNNLQLRLKISDKSQISSEILQCMTLVQSGLVCTSSPHTDCSRLMHQKVTGCSSGVGKSLVTTIHGAGYRVVATARDIVSLSYIPDGPNVLKLTLDVTSEDNIIEALSATVANFGRLDVVINNAGYAVMGDTEVILEADARLEMETLFWGPAFITREAVRIFWEVNPAGRGGTVVQMSSIGGLVTFPGSAFYHAGYAMSCFCP